MVKFYRSSLIDGQTIEAQTKEFQAHKQYAGFIQNQKPTHNVSNQVHEYLKVGKNECNKHLQPFILAKGLKLPYCQHRSNGR